MASVKNSLAQRIAPFTGWLGREDFVKMLKLGWRMYSEPVLLAGIPGGKL